MISQLASTEIGTPNKRNNCQRLLNMMHLPSSPTGANIHANDVSGRGLPQASSRPIFRKRSVPMTRATMQPDAAGYRNTECHRRDSLTVELGGAEE